MGQIAMMPGHTSALVVDDEDFMALELAESLSFAGIQTATACSAREALEKVARSPDIAVIVSDITMPGMAGYEMAQAVRQSRGEENALEVVLMTGRSRMTQDEAERYGAYSVLYKPFTVAEMTQAVMQALESARQRRRAAATAAALS